MKQVNCTCGADSCMLSYLWSRVAPRQVCREMTEEDILYLQDIFLTNGMHAIQVPDVHAGRSIIHTMLQSLNYYQNVSCMTGLRRPPLENSIIDLYSMVLNSANGAAHYEAIENFFIEEFFSDFLWVELSQDFFDSPMLVHAIHAIHSLDMSRRMPIVALSYAV